MKTGHPGVQPGTFWQNGVKKGHTRESPKTSRDASPFGDAGLPSKAASGRAFLGDQARRLCLAQAPALPAGKLRVQRALRQRPDWSSPGTRYHPPTTRPALESRLAHRWVESSRRTFTRLNAQHTTLGCLDRWEPHASALRGAVAAAPERDERARLLFTNQTARA